ncbi:MAG: hypothetical protein F2768_03250, partial [Actinobacteria bacterium]|nr:hypothetical protein [Actinomycetota bacterium]
MKRVAVLLIVLLGITASADAAPKTISVKKLLVVAPAPGAEGLVISGKTLVTYSNTSGINSNVVVTGLDSNGATLWQKTIDSGADEIALAASVDSNGDIWLAGDSAALTPSDTATTQLPPDNPDGVIVEPQSSIRNDMNQLTVWKVSPIGELIATYTLTQKTPPLVNAISINASGASIVGQIADKPYVISVSATGTFGKLINVGTSKTQLNAVIRNSDGSASVFGSSSETLGGKKNAGIRDGVLLKINKAGAITSVVRSSASKAVRSWNSSDPSLVLTGSIKTGKKNESAFTKFTSAFVPSWTIRIPSNGISLVTSAGGITYGVMGSNTVIPGISGWKPTSTQLLLLILDGKGLVTSAYGATELSFP